ALQTMCGISDIGAHSYQRGMVNGSARVSYSSSQHYLQSVPFFQNKQFSGHIDVLAKLPLEDL
ncbi:hypothetical protein ACJX0J_032023, partial [Zea mays]